MKTPLLSVIERYIGKEVFWTFLAVFLVLIIIFASAFLVRALTDASSGIIPNDLIFTHMGLRLVRFTPLILPFSWYLAIVFVFTRMYQDNEAVALFACGVGYGKFYRAVFLVAFPLMIFTAWLSLQAGPLAAQIEYNLLKEYEQDLEVTGISPQKFKEVSGGERVMYVESVSEDRKRANNVFIYAKVFQRTVLFSAATARIENNDIGERYLILENGFRYDFIDSFNLTEKELDAAKACVSAQAEKNNDGCAMNFRITRYKEHTVKLIPKTLREAQLRQNAMPTKILWASKRNQDIGEVQWRVALIAQVLVLALFAVPISKVKPRHGRFVNVILAVLVFVGYFYLQTKIRDLVLRQAIPVSYGWWLAHTIMIGFTMALLVRQHGMRWLLNPWGDKHK